MRLNSYSYQTAQMSIKLNGINCFYGAHQALFDITLDCPQGETLVLLGPSGAGKSSLLRVLNLLEMPRSGSLSIAGNQFDFTRAPSDKAIRELRQNVGMVFQQYNLWPHLTVQQNLIEAPCRVLGVKQGSGAGSRREAAGAPASEAVQRSLPAAFIRRPAAAGGYRPRADDGAAGSAVR